MKGLHDPDGRRRLAEVVVWGTPARRMTRDQIAKRLEAVLKRISKKIRVDVGGERGTRLTECALTVDTPAGGTSARGNSEINSTVAREHRDSQSGTSARLDNWQP